MKNSKTNLVGHVALVVLASSIALVFFEKATLTEVGSTMGVIFGALFALSNYLSKDFDKTHSVTGSISKESIGGDLPPPDEEEEPVG